jgi:hypothetical protein
MTWRTFKAYFDLHVWTTNPLVGSWFVCSVCGETRTANWMFDHEDDLYPEVWI